MNAPEKKIRIADEHKREGESEKNVWMSARARPKTTDSSLPYTNEDHKHFDVLFFIYTHVSSHYNTLILSPWLVGCFFLLLALRSLSSSLSLFLFIFQFSRSTHLVHSHRCTIIKFNRLTMLFYGFIMSIQTAQCTHRPNLNETKKTGERIKKREKLIFVAGHCCCYIVDSTKDQGNQ